MRKTDKPEGAKHGWHRLGTSYPFTTKWLKLRQDHVKLDGDGEIDFTYVDSPGAVGVVPVTSDGRMMLIRQYRYTVDEVSLEVPAGGLHDSAEESLEDVARKELREEVGAMCKELQYIACFYMAIGQGSQPLHVFLALDVELTGTQELEPAERIEIEPTPVEEALRLARSGAMMDGASALAVLLCENALREHGYV